MPTSYTIEYDVCICAFVLQRDGHSVPLDCMLSGTAGRTIYICIPTYSARSAENISASAQRTREWTAGCLVVSTANTSTPPRGCHRMNMTEHRAAYIVRRKLRRITGVLHDSVFVVYVYIVQGCLRLMRANHIRRARTWVR
ncbi:hypothetical protein BDN71DRAFT_462980 [Pleurotus eryngii]|uniref:Uncharacterized protein n=1 Tax=Pleurotus eryngii TaxID=5323 RepID=A0A9P6D2C4_PLEER|nr:hypothetical protein BDN71DRAFT_462980 [Pleurotus eryngii]